VTSYLNGQILAGAQAVQIFDTWGGNLSAAAYQEFSLAYMRKIVSGLIREHEGRKVPVILFTKNGGLWLESIAEAGADALGLDWTCEIGDARRRVGDKVALQGNMDPTVLYAKPEAIRNEVARILASYGKGTGHVFNLGHGITPEVDPSTPACSSTPCMSCRRSITSKADIAGARSHVLLQDGAGAGLPLIFALSFNSAIVGNLVPSKRKQDLITMKARYLPLILAPLFSTAAPPPATPAQVLRRDHRRRRQRSRRRHPGSAARLRDQEDQQRRPLRVQGQHRHHHRRNRRRRPAADAVQRQDQGQADRRGGEAPDEP
jgi:hypothetical protein